MGVAYFVRADERSELAGSAPTRDEILAALRTVADPTHAFPRSGGGEGYRRIGRWIGPSPRVTRVFVPVATGNAFRTRVAWIYGISDEEETSQLSTPQAKQAFADNLARDVFQQLETRAGRPALIGDHWSVTVSGYSPAENGSPEWWESGAASREATYVDTFPPIIQQQMPDDNPSGPNSVHANPTPPDPLTTIAWIVGGTAAIILAVQFGPAISSWVPTKSKTKAALANPRLRKRH